MPYRPRLLGHCSPSAPTPCSQMQQRRVVALQRSLTDARAALASSEAARSAAEERVRELSSEADNTARVFALHYETLLAKDEEIRNLQTVIAALASGQGAAGGDAAVPGTPTGHSDSSEHGASEDSAQ